MSTIKVGTKFRFHYADSNPEWTVISSRGTGAWNCQILDDPDWKGTKKVFGTEEIKLTIERANFFTKIVKTSRDWWSQQKEGAVVHYHNAFGSFVRGIIVKIDNETEMRPIALVGNWSTIDLPHRMADGEILWGYHPEKVLKGTVFKPHSSNVFESPDYAGRKDVDPRTLEPIDLSVPEMTETEKFVAAKHIFLKKIQAVIDFRDVDGSIAKIRELMK